MVTNLLGKRVRVMCIGDVEHVGTIAAVYDAYEPSFRQPSLHIAIIRDGDSRIMDLDPLNTSFYLPN